VEVVKNKQKVKKTAKVRSKTTHWNDKIMRDFRQKEKKKLPQNKVSRDEPCLPRCNTSSTVGSAEPRNMAALTQFISSAMGTFWPWLCCTCLLLLFFPLKQWQLTNNHGRLIRLKTRYYTRAGKARHGSVCFEATSFILFGGSPSLIGDLSRLIEKFVWGFA